MYLEKNHYNKVLNADGFTLNSYQSLPIEDTDKYLARELVASHLIIKTAHPAIPIHTSKGTILVLFPWKIKKGHVDSSIEHYDALQYKFRENRIYNLEDFL